MRRPRLTLQFSLRTLLALTILCAIPLGWLGAELHQVQLRREAVEYFSRLGAEIGYEHLSNDQSSYSFVAARPHVVPKNPGPAWARRWLGNDFFMRVTSLQLRQSGQITDSEFSNVQHLPHLKSLKLGHSSFDDACAKRLSALKALEIVQLDSTRITDDGMRHLRDLPHLRFVLLDHTHVSDRSLAHLATCQRLEYVNVAFTTVTAKGVQAMQEELPDCTIVH